MQWNITLEYFTVFYCTDWVKFEGLVGLSGQYTLPMVLKLCAVELDKPTAWLLCIFGF